MSSRSGYLVATDFSPASRRAVAAARALARKTGATVTVAHVRPTSDARAAVNEERGDLFRPPVGSLRTRIAAHYARRLGAAVSAGERPLLLSGAPDIALCREAARGYDLIVLGNRGRGAVGALFLGTIAQRVLARSPIPVLIVPSRRRS